MRNLTLQVHLQLLSQVTHNSSIWIIKESSSFVNEVKIGLNGVSTEGVGSIMEAACAVITGVTIAFIFSWRMSLVCLCLAPFGVITGYMGAKRHSGLGEEQD